VRRFLVKRGASLVGILVVLTFVVFVLQQLSPADPVKAKLGANATRETVEAERERLGYNDPTLVQFGRYLGGVARGDLGDSLRTKQPVRDDLGEFLPASIELMATIVLLAGVLGVVLAMITARVGRGAGVVRVGMTAAASAPAFLVALLMMLLFYRRLGWLPASGRSGYRDAPTGPTGLLTVDGLLAGRPAVTLDAVRHLLLPAVAASIAPAVSVALVLRSSLLATLRADFVRTARAKGLRERRVVLRHALRNAAGPALSVAGLLIASLFAGSLIVESIVSWPGLGLYTLRSLSASDFPAIAGITLVLGAIYVAVNTLVEVVQAALDPRLRL
jgi:peptide/nickel transport system permease protein